jgi:tetratricopeptide (TPR) repeat protein
LPGAGYAQDSLVYLRDLRFNSAFEEDAIRKNIALKENDPFGLLMANGSLLNEEQIARAKTDLYGYLKNLNTAKFAGKKSEVRAKAMVKGIQEKYLKKYQAGSKFEDIFHGGNFSEVSGTALYCLGFEYLEIPYEIKEDANNTYVVACPGPKQIMVESTFQALTFTTFDGNFKKQFVETLRGQKLISEGEFARTSIADLFDKYYFRSNPLFNLQELAARQYFEEGSRQIEQQDFSGAFQNLEKSYYLATTPRTVYLLMHSGAMAFDKLTVKDNKHAVLLGKISRYTGVGITEEMIESEFLRVMQDLVFDKGQLEKMDEYYKVFMTTCDNVSIEHAVTFVYQSELGRFKHNDARYRDALVHFEEAYRLKPTNQDASNRLINCLGMVPHNNLEDEEFVKIIESYTTNLPEITNNNLFNGLLASVYLMHTAINYESARAEKGDLYKKNFEALYSIHQDMKVSSNLVGRAYSAAAIHYFRKGMTKKAKEFVAAGLKIAPNNHELLVRQQMMR